MKQRTYPRILAVVNADGYPDRCLPDTPRWRKHIRRFLRPGQRVLVYQTGENQIECAVVVREVLCALIESGSVKP